MVQGIVFCFYLKKILTIKKTSAKMFLEFILARDVKSRAIAVVGVNPRLSKISNLGVVMDELKELFGDETLDYATFEQKIGEKGIKLANLKAGGYIDKAKYDKLAGEFTKYKTDNDISKYADYDAIKQELETLKAEKQEAELLKVITEAKVSEKFRKFVLSEVKPLVTEKKDFKSCLSDYIKDNPQFLENNQGVFQKSSQVDIDSGAGGSDKSTNKKMNEILRGVRK